MTENPAHEDDLKPTAQEAEEVNGGAAQPGLRDSPLKRGRHGDTIINRINSAYDPTDQEV